MKAFWLSYEKFIFHFFLSYREARKKEITLVVSSSSIGYGADKSMLQTVKMLKGQKNMTLFAKNMAKH